MLAVACYGWLALACYCLQAKASRGILKK